MKFRLPRPYLPAAIAVIAIIAGGAVHEATRVSAAPQLSAGASDQEREIERANPTLAAAARQYFPGSVAAAPSKRIFRLTRDQLDASAKTLLPGIDTGSAREAMPRDLLQTNYEYAEVLSFNAANISPMAKWVSDLADKVRQKPAAAIDCPAENAPPACLKDKARAFIVKAFRGDVAEERLEKIASFYVAGVQSVGFAAATGDLVEVVLSSPHFLFRKELDVNADGRLAPAQLLQAVTYTLTDAPPEAVNLSSSKADTYLRTGKEAAATIEKIVTSKQSRDKILRFFNAWLEIKDTADFTISKQSFPEFNSQLAAAMRAETREFLRAQLAAPAPKLKDITQSTRSFVPKSLAPLYGLEAAASAASAPGRDLIDLDPSQRLGIFSQPAVIASHSGPTDSRPIKRGVFWVRKAMCMEMDAPPLGVETKLVETSGLTERQRIEQTTGAPACAGCHKVINPFAFFMESYDALGRWRTTDNGLPIDTSVLINFLDEEPVKTTTAVEALKTMTNSMMFKQCFVRQLFRFYMGRTEEPHDHPLLRRMLLEFAHNDEQDILRTIQVMVSSDRIVKRQ